MMKENLSELQIEMSNYAEQIATAYNLRLDYSNQSIKIVEKILSKTHFQYKRDNNEEGLNGVALEFAFYIISVIEKNFERGKVERDHKDFGENTFPFYWRGVTLFPYAWCQKRIFDGESDNVWIKYKTIILGEKKKGFGFFHN